MPAAESALDQSSFVTRRAVPPAIRPRIEYPSLDGKPMAETPRHLQAMVDAIQPLQDHLEDRPDAHVGGNMMIYYEEGNPRKSVSPDVFVAFGVDKEPPRDVWLTWKEEKLADFVLEVTSMSTRGNDTGPKMSLYARLGVAEYWLYDPTGDYLAPRLAGHRLGPDGAYREIGLAEEGASVRGRSDVLGLELRLEGARLRLFDSDSGEYLLANRDKDRVIRDQSRIIEGQQAESQRLKASVQRLQEEIRRLRQG